MQPLVGAAPDAVDTSAHSGTAATSSGAYAHHHDSSSHSQQHQRGLSGDGSVVITGSSTAGSPTEAPGSGGRSSSSRVQFMRQEQSPSSTGTQQGVRPHQRHLSMGGVLRGSGEAGEPSVLAPAQSTPELSLRRALAAQAAEEQGAAGGAVGTEGGDASNIGADGGSKWGLPGLGRVEQLVRGGHRRHASMGAFS
jgi:hypothetical protein